MVTLLVYSAKQADQELARTRSQLQTRPARENRRVSWTPAIFLETARVPNLTMVI